MDFLKELKIQSHNAGSSTGSKWFDNIGQTIESFSPVNGNLIAAVSVTTRENYDQIVSKAHEAWLVWRTWPAPKRGEIVRQVGEALREKKHALGSLVSYEMGKSLQEGLGEVQEMIDICDFAVGLSRQLHGFTMHSERPQHRMYRRRRNHSPAAGAPLRLLHARSRQGGTRLSSGGGAAGTAATRTATADQSARRPSAIALAGRRRAQQLWMDRQTGRHCAHPD